MSDTTSDAPGLSHIERHAPSVTLSDIPFANLYVESSGTAWFKKWADDPARNALPDEAMPELQGMMAHVKVNFTKPDFRLKWAGVNMRGTRLESADGDMYVFRKTLPRPLDFMELGYGQRLEEALLTRRKDGGQLYLFTGESSAGKTIGLTAWTAKRMSLHGGAGFTLENPIEIDMEGTYAGRTATGTLYQKEVDDDKEFAAEVRRRLRAAPNLIMLSELRTPESVAQAMIAAASGIVVGATFHGADQITGLQRLSAMSHEAGLSGGMFANSLAAVIHQRLHRTETSAGVTWKLELSPLIVSGAKEEPAIRSMLQGTDFRQLQTTIDRHRRAMNSTDKAVGF